MLATIGVLLGALSCCPPTDVPPTYYAEQVNDDEHRRYAGNYTLTAYTWTGNTCADGIYPCAGVTVASNDPKLWHKAVSIEGYGVFFVHDTCGSASNNVIDIYVDTYDEAIWFGVQSAEVYIID